MNSGFFNPFLYLRVGLGCFDPIPTLTQQKEELKWARKTYLV